MLDTARRDYSVELSLNPNSKTVSKLISTISGKFIKSTLDHYPPLADVLKPDMFARLRNCTNSTSATHDVAKNEYITEP